MLVYLKVFSKFWKKFAFQIRLGSGLKWLSLLQNDRCSDLVGFNTSFTTVCLEAEGTYILYLTRQNQEKIETRFGWGAPGPCNSATHGRRSKTPVASYCGGPSPSRN